MTYPIYDINFYYLALAVLIGFTASILAVWVLWRA